jgi:type IV secretion system protein VirB3
MSNQLSRDSVFVALTRPQMFAGVTYNYFIANAILAVEVFLIFKSFWALAIGVVVHFIGVALCIREPRFFDLWISRISHCPRVKNYTIWGCNSYRP